MQRLQILATQHQKHLQNKKHMVRLFVPILLISLGLLSDLYIFHRYINTSSTWRWTWWAPSIIVIGFFIKFLFFNRGWAEEYSTTNIFLLIMTLVCIPKMIFALLSMIPKIGTYIGLAAGTGIVWIILWGITWGFLQFKIKEITVESEYVPKSFDNYRIVQFSDAHVGSFYGPYKHLLQESIDSINKLKPDMVCFVGDIENFTPEELEKHKHAFSSLRARDGVFSIMGNHDYSSYIKVTDRERAASVERTRNMQRSFGWQLLENENRIIKRCNDSIIVVGEENWGKPPFPQYGNLKKALQGVDKNSFTVMLSHDPTAWKAHILPVFTPDITLSGHTHGTQFSIFGWSPSSMVYDEWGGLYKMNANGKNCILNVSTGIGGNFPFRFGMPREAVVITLKHKK